MYQKVRKIEQCTLAVRVRVTDVFTEKEKTFSSCEGLNDGDFVTVLLITRKGCFSHVSSVRQRKNSESSSDSAL